MSAPGIELRWGYGFDNKPRKREMARPFVRTAIELAQEGIYNMGLSIDDRKYLWVEQKEAKDKWNGGAKGKTCHVAISDTEIQRRRIDTVWLAAFMLHELVHLIHEEYSPGEGLINLAASEGIAHIAQYEFANELLHRKGRRGPPHRVVERIRAMPKREVSRLEADFWKAGAKPDSDSDAVVKQWFEKFAPPIDFPKGATVGVNAVSRQLKCGWEIAELITLPPHEVLDVA